MRAHLDAEITRIAQLISYCPETGAFTRNVKCGWKSVNTAPGTIVHGHLRLALDGKRHYAHRIAWLLIHGEWPDGQIDHINGNRLDNRIQNLRVVTNAVNQQNRHVPRSDNTTGLLGAMRAGNRFVSKITTNGVKRHLGTFDTAEEAHRAFVAARLASSS